MGDCADNILATLSFNEKTVSFADIKKELNGYFGARKNIVVEKARLKKKSAKTVRNNWLLHSRSLQDSRRLQHYSPKFQAIKKQNEKKPVKFFSDNTEDYNQPFSLLELKEALQKSNDTAVGPDDMH